MRYWDIYSKSRSTNYKHIEKFIRTTKADDQDRDDSLYKTSEDDINEGRKTDPKY